MADESDSLMMRIGLDAEGLKKGVTEIEKNTARLDGIGNSIKGIGGQIKEAFHFLGIGLAMKQIIRESEDLKKAMEPIHKLMSDFGDQLVPGFRILGNTIQDVTHWIGNMSRGMGEASIIARGFAVAMELLRVLVIGLVNGFVFLYNVLKMTFEGLATAVAFVATGIFSMIAKVLEGVTFLARGWVTAFDWMAQKIKEVFGVTLTKAIRDTLESMVAAIDTLPEAVKAMMPGIGLVSDAMAGMANSFDEAIVRSRSLKEIWDDSKNSVTTLTDAVTTFKNLTAEAADVTKMKWDDTKQAFLDLGNNMKELDLEDVLRRLTNASMGWGANFGIAAKHVVADVKAVANSFKFTEGLVKAALSSIAAGFEVFGATGKLTAKAFAGTFISALGDLCIALGTTIVLASQAITALKASIFGTGAAAIVLGGALIALGGILKGAGSSMANEGGATGAASAPGSAGGTVTSTADALAEEKTEEKAKPQTHVIVNITGADMLPRDQWQQVVREHIAPAIQRIVRDEGVTVIDGVFPSGV